MSTTDPARWKHRLAHLWTILVTAGAVWSVLSIPIHLILRSFDNQVAELFESISVPTGHTFFSAVYLTVIAIALRRGKHLAVMWTFWFFGVLGIIASLGNIGFEVEFAHGRPGVDLSDFTTSDQLWNLWLLALSIVIAYLIWNIRDCYPARLAHGSRRHAIVILATGLALSAAVAIVLTEAFPKNLHGQHQKLFWAISSARGVAHSISFSGIRGHDWVAYVAGLISAATVILALITFLRSVLKANVLSQQDELDVRRLLLENGDRDSLGYFATRRDKSMIWSPNRDAAIAYRVVAGVSLASGDPLGHPRAWGPVIDTWLNEAREYGWSAGVMSASDEGAKAYAAHGLRALSMGDEAIIDVSTFTLEGPTMSPVRQAIRRIERFGYRATVIRHADLTQTQRTEVIARTEDWRGNQTERGFSMALGRLGDPADDNCVIVLAHNSHGVLEGLLSFVPWGRRGVSLDLMRRDPRSVNGLMEFMVAALVNACLGLGVRQISLNFAMFREVFSDAERVGAGPVLRMSNKTLLFASRFWQLHSLYQSNQKYLPRWVPRHVCYARGGSLLQVLTAGGIAEGFLPGRTAPERVDPDSVEASSQSLDAAGFVARVKAQEAELAHAEVPPRAVTQQERVRRTKLAELRAVGMDPYPVEVPRTTSVADVVARHHLGDHVSITGRVVAKRDHGRLNFADIREGSATVQTMMSVDPMGPALLGQWRRLVDAGDRVSITGEVVASERGELSVLATSWMMAAKCLRPLPDNRHRLTDPTLRSRRRVLDIMVNASARRNVELRSAAVRALRDGFLNRGFTEVETPMLHTIPGGASARPFFTHINAYDTDLSLRIAPELYLKRLCVAGLEQIFEIGRNFRNEGADSSHNPEFTSVEAYRAYADYTTMRHLTHDLVVEVATQVLGRPVLLRPMQSDGPAEEIDVSGPWPVVTVYDAVSAAVGSRVDSMSTLTELRKICNSHRMQVKSTSGCGQLIESLYGALVEPTTVRPTFYIDFPVETSPLTRVHRSDPRLAERWDLVAFGMEIGTAYSELTDPLEQRRRFTEQSLRAAAGDPEAMSLDEDFLGDFEYAMPPTGGLGLGVDRLIMLLTGCGIRQSITFPFVRPLPD